jgi:hypothetical protein
VIGITTFLSTISVLKTAYFGLQLVSDGKKYPAAIKRQALHDDLKNSFRSIVPGLF